MDDHASPRPRRTGASALALLIGAAGDVLWTVRGSEAHVAEALEQLPG